MATRLEDIIAEVDRNPELAEALSERLVTASAVMRLMDENPDLMEELRARLLTRELLELPATLAAFIETTNRKFEEVARRFDEMDNQFVEVNRRLTNMDRRFDRIDSDFSHFRFYYTEAGATKRAAGIAINLGMSKGLRLRRIRNLSQDELIDILDSGDAWSTFSYGEVQSFVDSDLIIAAHDEHGETCYIAVEASYTCDSRDTDRAIAHARLLERFTGKRAFPAIAGVRRDDRILDIIESGEVFWHALQEENLRP